MRCRRWNSNTLVEGNSLVSSESYRFKSRIPKVEVDLPSRLDSSNLLKTNDLDGAEGGNFVGRALKLPFPITYDSKDSLPLNRARRIMRTAGMKRNTMDSVWTRKVPSHISLNVSRCGPSAAYNA
jgi:hypothetical protein